jgi:hypothetical protein
VTNDGVGVDLSESERLCCGGTVDACGSAGHVDGVRDIFCRKISKLKVRKQRKNVCLVAPLPWLVFSPFFVCSFPDASANKTRRKGKQNFVERGGEVLGLSSLQPINVLRKPPHLVRVCKCMIA